MTQALEGLKILDLTRYAPGPYCTMILGDLGADIIKIEEVRPPDSGGSGQSKAPANITHPPELAYMQNHMWINSCGIGIAGLSVQSGEPEQEKHLFEPQVGKGAGYLLQTGHRG